MIKDHETKGFSNADYWVFEWLKSDKRDSANTHDAYRRDIKMFLSFCVKPFDSIQIIDIDEYQSRLIDEHRSSTTIARKLSSIRSFYRFLNRREVTNLNIDRIESPKIQQTLNKKNLLTEKEVQVLIEAAKSSFVHWIYVRFLYLTAVRVSESLSVKWRDITELSDDGEVYILGKGDKPRTVYIPCQLLKDLFLMRGGAAENDFIFPALDRYKAWDLLKRLAKMSKIEKSVSPHALRHAHLSHAAKEGASLIDLRDQAGHSNISTTSLYLHSDKKRATATKLKIH